MRTIAKSLLANIGAVKRNACHGTVNWISSPDGKPLIHRLLRCGTAYNPAQCEICGTRLLAKLMTAIELSSWILLPLLAASGLSIEDRTIVRILLRAEPSLKHVTIVKRFPANEQLNLVVAIGRPWGGDYVPSDTFVWTNDTRLGLFLQDRANAGRVYQLAIKAGLGDDYSAKIERSTGRELVLSGTGEKGSTYDNQKFIFDVRAKTLVAHFSYPPFWVSQLLDSPKGPHFVMADRQQLLLVETGAGSPDLRVVPKEQARLTLSRIPIEESSVPGDRVYRTPVPPTGVVPVFGPRKQFRLATEKNQDGSGIPACGAKGRSEGKAVSIAPI